MHVLNGGVLLLLEPIKDALPPPKSQFTLCMSYCISGDTFVMLP